MATDSEVYQAYWTGRTQWDREDLLFRQADLIFRRETAASTKANDEIRNAQIIAQTQAMLAIQAAGDKEAERDQLERLTAMVAKRYSVADPWRKPDLIVAEARVFQLALQRTVP